MRLKRLRDAIIGGQNIVAGGLGCHPLDVCVQWGCCKAIPLTLRRVGETWPKTRFNF